MVGLEKAKTSSRVALGSVGILMLVLAATGGSVAQARAHPDLVRATVPAGTLGALNGVAAVPHSSDAWVIGELPGFNSDHFFVARRHNGHWQRMKTPNLGGLFGELDGVAAGSGKAVWIVGGKVARGSHEAPVIFRWNGKKFVSQKLPKVQRGDVDVSSISASSAKNAWAVGGMHSVSTGDDVALHWNGKKWSAVPVPTGDDSEGLLSVSTSSARNAWALASDSELFHWNGTAWAEDGTAPVAVQLVAVATSSPTLAYAVGYKATTERPVVLRFDGKKWSTAPLAKGVRGKGQLVSVTMHGASAWAVGTQEARNDVITPLILHSTGRAWKPQQRLREGYTLNAVSAESAKRVYAAGGFEFESAGKTFFDVDAGHGWTGVSSEF